jgi:hypothetical protein
MGSKIIPTNSLLIFPDSVTPLIEVTKNSAVTATSYIESMRANDGAGYEQTVRVN